MLGIVSDTDFDLELDRLNGGEKHGEIIDIHRGRGSKLETPEVLRKVIGENAIEEGSKATKVLTRALDISDSSLSAYKNGATSTTTYHEGNGELKNHIDETKKKILSRSRSRLLSAINHITKEKLKSSKARDLAGVAKDMSAVIKNLEPEVQERKDGPTFILYAPQTRREETYEIIQVND